MPRADRFTTTGKTLEYYSDFPIDFSKNPVTGNLAKITNEEAIKSSLRNLVLTNLGTRPYEPLLGSKIKSILFDPIDSITEGTLKSSIKESCAKEPRANILDIDVAGNVDRNLYTVKITFECINIPNQSFTVNLIIKRIR